MFEKESFPWTPRRLFLLHCLEGYHFSFSRTIPWLSSIYFSHSFIVIQSCISSLSLNRYFPPWFILSAEFPTRLYSISSPSSLRTKFNCSNLDDTWNYGYWRIAYNDCAGRHLVHERRLLYGDCWFLEHLSSGGAVKWRRSSRILVLYIGIFENEIYITWYIGILQNGISVYLYIVEWNIRILVYLSILVYCRMEYPYIGISIHQ